MLTEILLLSTCSPLSLSFLARAFADPTRSNTNFELGATEEAPVAADDDSASSCDDL